MSALFVAHSEIFPNPLSFIPERWLESDGSIGPTANKLEHCLLAFGKGSRSCVGVSLAYAELYSVLSAVLRRFGRRIELYKTTERDLEAVHDYFAGMG